MRGTRAKLLGRGLNKSERRLAIRKYKAARHAKAGFSAAPPEPHRPGGAGRGLKGAKLPPANFNGAVRPAHPIRGIEKFFAELSEVGQEKALRLKFRPVLTKGAPESRRAWPRGRPGQGAASRMDKRSLHAAIKALDQHRNVQKFGRI